MKNTEPVLSLAQTPKSFFDELGERVKTKEKKFAAQKFEENVPFCVRIDGKAFHTYTKSLARPYDERLSKAFIATMNYLVEESGARLGYTQSDEISLVFFQTAPHQTNIFGSRVQKLSSVLASMATACFNDFVKDNIPERRNTYALFDARVWSVPTMADAAEVIVWRQEDAIKNAISMAASAYYPQTKLHKKSSAQKIDMLSDKGVSWSEYPEFFKTGTFAQRKMVEKTVPPELKEFKSNAASDTFLRSEVVNFHMPRLKKMENWESILFDNIMQEHRDTTALRNKRKKGF